jgi:hypothetical protein
MNNNEIVKNILLQSRDVFENTYKAVTILQDNNQKLTEQVMEKANFLPAEVREVNERWFKAAREVREKFRDNVLNGHKQLEDLVTSA